MSRAEKAGQGIYLYGSVGTGKTELATLTASCLPEHMVLTIHFNQFMNRVHELLAEYNQEASQKEESRQENPLNRVAREIMGSARCLCFDEFFVEDIADAMVLSRLIQVLVYDMQVSLICTSNTPVAGLYANGLHRSRFMPAITTLQNCCTEINLTSDHDYRRREIADQYYRYPLSVQNRADICGLFALLTQDLQQGQDQDKAKAKASQEIQVLGRAITVLGVNEQGYLFDFQAICGHGRSYRDYVELIRPHHVIAVVGIPQLSDTMLAETRRFIALIDEIYVRGAQLAVEAETIPTDLYTGTELKGPFERTASRLIELQSSTAKS